VKKYLYVILNVKCAKILPPIVLLAPILQKDKIIHLYVMIALEEKPGTQRNLLAKVKKNIFLFNYFIKNKFKLNLRIKIKNSFFNK
jgi:hypothetical protein